MLHVCCQLIIRGLFIKSKRYKVWQWVKIVFIWIFYRRNMQREKDTNGMEWMCIYVLYIYKSMGV